MGQLSDHLRSPQLTDADGNPTAPARMAMVVAPGKPRWLGYVFYLGTFVLGAILAFGIVNIGDSMAGDLARIVGVVTMFGSVYGAWEVWRGKALSLKGVIDRIRGR